MEHKDDKGFRAVAPGRLDVMGGIADYSGSLLLQMPIAEQTEVLLRPVEGRFVIHSDQQEGVFTINKSDTSGLTYRELGTMLRSMPGGSWASYVVGCFAVLEQERGISLNGAEVKVRSDVPLGKGVSSSASLELAVMHAIGKATGVSIDPVELSLLAQLVENEVAGAPCGLMDQLSVNLGRKDHLLPIICQPHQVDAPLRIPVGISFAGVDSGVRHAVSDASYGDVRTAAFMGYTMAMMRSGVSAAQLLDPHTRPYGGCWANVPLDVFDNDIVPLLPETISGAAYLREFGVHIDPATTVDPSTTYRVRAASRHPVAEHHRISRFMALMEIPQPSDQQIREMGELMFASHEGYSSVGLGEPVTSRIVDMVREKGWENGVAGARISGGGSGGTVSMMIYRQDGYRFLESIRTALAKETGKSHFVFLGSSDGAHYLNQ